VSQAGLRGRVITVSDRVATGSASDGSGPLAVTLLAGHGVSADAPVVVPDDCSRITAAVSDGVLAGVDVIVLTGGTGIGPRDVTPEAVRPMLTKELPGLAEAVRAHSRAIVPTADLSRLVVGVAGRAIVVALPGSTGGVHDALDVIGPLLGHAVTVLRGGDHGSEPSEPSGSSFVTSNEVAPRVVICQVTHDELDVPAHESAVAGPAAGAVVTFAGVVRDQDDGRAVLRLEYEGHPDAAVVLAEVVATVASTTKAEAFAVSHRVGVLEIGDAALVVSVSAAHRADAFAACARLVDEVKLRLPVWKHQWFVDGSDEWVNCA
jgi:molybdenum cofactor synthesis domain-containing protein